jgi:hypothetical protein
LHGLIANDCEGQPVLLSFRYTDKAPIAGDAKCFVVRADEKLSAFVELETAVRK